MTRQDARQGVLFSPQGPCFPWRDDRDEVPTYRVSAVDMIECGGEYDPGAWGRRTGGRRVEVIADGRLT